MRTEGHENEGTAAATPPICHRCGALLKSGEGSFYVVRIEAFADPSPPDLDDPRLSAVGVDDLLGRMKGMTERELMDQVYRRMTILLCRTCYVSWIERPTG